MGGLPKKAQQLQLMKQQESPAPFLTLDGGALLFDGAQLPAAREAQAKATAAGIVKAYNLMGYDAAGVSRHDLAGGLTFLQEQAGRSHFAWLSANLVDARGRPIFKSHLVKKAGSLSVAVIGLTSEEGDDPPGAAILPWEKALPPLVASLRETSDFMILLTDLPAGKVEAITARLPEIRIVIQAEGHATNLAPAAGSPVLICRTASQGKYLGILDIDWRGGSSWGRNRQELLLEKKRDLDQVSWLLRRQPASAELTQKQQLLTSEVDDLEKGAGASSFSNRFLALNAELPDEPAVLAITEGLRQEIHQLGSKTAREQAEARNGQQSAASFPYAGWQACGECHPGQLQQWQQTGHAGAYRTLAARKQQFNLDCLSCHFTGYEQADTDILTAPVDLQAVGCESCHGPGRQHVKAPRQESMIRSPQAETCLRCHTPERSDAFDFARDLPKVLHR